MQKVQKIIRRTLLTGAAVGLCALTAFADDVTVPYQATVAGGAVTMYASAESDAEEIATLSQGDTVVLLSNETSGLQPAAFEDGDDVISGFIDADVLTPEAVGEASVLTESAALRAQPDADAEASCELSRNETVQILSYNDQWYFVRSGDQTGFLLVSELDADVVTSSRLKLRTEPNTDCDVLTVLPRDTVLTPEASDGDWIQVSVDGETGYVYSEFVDATEDSVVKDPTMSDGEAVAAFAVQFEGNPYVWGGTSLTNGCDCSGFVMKVYENFGVSLPHSSRSIRSCGTAVSRSDIQPGDVVCYSGHVGIYVGDGQIINALNSRVGIVYSDIDVMRVVGIRRML